MKNQLEHHRKTEKELLKQIALCKAHKKHLEKTLKEHHMTYASGNVDAQTYHFNLHKFLQGKHPSHWHKTYDYQIAQHHQHLEHCRQKIHEITGYLHAEKKFTSKLWLVIGIALVLVAGIGFIDNPITGFLSYDTIEEGSIVSEDGYGKEGTRWMAIRGDRIYERCLKVTATTNFDAVRIIGKIMSASDQHGLTLSLYKPRIQEDEPGEMVGACRITEFESVWKSCVVSTKEQTQGDYWICASQPQGDKEESYYTIAYQVGDAKKTALWTGQNWQKLDHASYTIKGEFLKQ